MTTQIIHGNSLTELPKLAEHSIDAIVTDPPYELGFMNKKWDASGIAYNVDLWRECLRVLKPGGHLLAFGGTRTYHRMVCAIEDAGFEIRDSIHWIYGSGFPKSLNVSKATDLTKEWQGWGTALKPAHEPIVLARKPLENTVATNVLTHGTGALNIDGCRIHRQPDDTSHAGHRTATFGTQQTVSGGDGSGGWTQNDTGRWPANIIFDDQAATELNEQSGIEASRFFYCAKPSKTERNAGLDAPPKKYNKYGNQKNGKDIGNGSVNDKFTTTPRQNFHPTVKPIALMRWLIRLITPPNGTILDPFTGSGTTLIAATLEGFHSIGIEITADYHPIIHNRLQWAQQQPPTLC